MSPIDAAKVQLRATYPSSATFLGLAADGNRLFVGGDDNAVHVFDLTSPKNEPVARWSKHDNYVSAMARVGSRVVTGGYDRRLVWWDAARGEAVRAVDAHAGWVRDVVAFPDGKRLASAGDDMLVKIWDAEKGQSLRTLSGHAVQTPQGHVTALYVVAVSPDGRHVAAAARHGTVVVWEAETGKIAQTFEVPTLYTYDPRQRKRSIGGVRALAFSPDGTLLAAGGIGQIGNVDGFAGPIHVEVWDWRTPKVRGAGGCGGNKGLVNDLVWRDATLIGGGGGGDGAFLAFWDLTKISDKLDGKKVKAEGHFHRFAINAAGTELYAAGHRRLDVWTLTGAAAPAAG